MALLACSTGALGASAAQAQEVRVLRVPGGEEREIVISGPTGRRMIGVSTVMESDRGDTLGLRVEAVTPGSPAEKAGLKAGDRLQSANGTSLRADRADAGNQDYDGALTRRLQRVIAEAKPGEAVTLRVLTGSTAREVKVVPAEATALTGEAFVRAMQPDRAVLGVMVGSTGTLRDTAGVFIQSVAKDGPAEKAGVYEGDRIAAINGVSLRVSREDAADEQVASGRAERLQAEVAKLKAGDAAELVVVSGGRSRTVRVTTGKASDLPQNEEVEMEMMMPRVVPGMPMAPSMRRAPGGEEMNIEVRKLPNGETFIERRGAPGGEMTLHDTPGEANVIVRRGMPGEENVTVRHGTPGEANVIVRRGAPGAVTIPDTPTPHVVIQKKVRIIL